MLGIYNENFYLRMHQNQSQSRGPIFKKSWGHVPKVRPPKFGMFCMPVHVLCTLHLCISNLALGCDPPFQKSGSAPAAYSHIASYLHATSYVTIATFRSSCIAKQLNYVVIVCAGRL